ncbi:MAG: translocation/assembly module TamB domain-containing protein [Abditibacteriales bacterium]|nr:translocation/assembly module TamB domain-containing protein [Abditibacteriales bacterium]MDW8365408.1 translocation/assembly module TamB domain-containing protein [Abditibacteriales bacterium]
MRRRLLKAFAGGFIGLLVLALGGYFFMRSQGALSIVHRIAVEQLAAALGTPVHISRVTGNPLRHVTAHHLRIAPDVNAPRGALFWANTVAVQYRGGDILRRKPFAATLRRVVVADFSLFLHRNARGEWNWQQLFPKKAAPQQLPFFADVVFQDGVIHLRDEMSRDARGRPLAQTLRVRRAVLDARHRSLVRMRADLTGDSLRHLRVNGLMTRDGRDARLTAQVYQFHPASWSQHFPRPPLPQFQRGAINGTIRLQSPDLFAQQLRITFASDLTLRNAVVLSHVWRRPVRNVHLSLTSAGEVELTEKTRLDVQGAIVGSLPHARSVKVRGRWSVVGGQSHVNATMRFDDVALAPWTQEVFFSLPLDVHTGQASGTVTLTTSAHGLTFEGQAVLSDVTAGVKNGRAPLQNLTWAVDFKAARATVARDGVAEPSVAESPPLTLHLTARERSGSVQALNLSGRFHGSHQGDGKVVVNGADLSRWAPAVLSPQQAQVLSGRLSANLTATWNAKRQRPLVVLGDVSVDNLATRIANAPRAFTNVVARLALTEDALIVRTASGRWGKSRVSVSGRITRLDRPALYLNITSPQLHVADLAALVPSALDLPRLRTTGEGHLRGRLTGAAHNPSFVGTVMLPQTRAVVRQGEVLVPLLSATVSVRNLTDPQFDVQGAFAQVDVSRLKLTGGATPVEIPAPMEGRFVVSGTSKRWRLTAEARLPVVRVGENHFTQVNASVVYADDVLRVNRLEATAGGGTVKGTGVVRSVRAQPVLHFNAVLNDVNVGKQGLWLGDWGLQAAQASGSGSIEGTWDDLTWRGAFSTRRARWASENVAVSVEAAAVTVRGRLPSQRRSAAPDRAATPDRRSAEGAEHGSASLASVQAHIASDGGQVRFELDTPRTVAFASAQADLTWQDGTLLAENVAVAAWGGVVTTDLLRYDSPTRGIVGTLRATRLNLQHLAQTFDLQTEPRAVGATVELSGTTERLVARLSVPELHLPNAPLSQTDALVVYHNRRLDFDEFKAHLAAGTFAGRGAVDFAESPPQFHLEGQVTNVPLSTWQSLWREQNLMLSGAASGTLLARGSARRALWQFVLTVSDFMGANVPQNEHAPPAQWQFKRLTLEVNAAMSQRVNGERQQWTFDIGRWTLTDGIVRAGAQPVRELSVRGATGAVRYDKGIVDAKGVAVQTLDGTVSGLDLRYVVDTGEVTGAFSVRDINAWALAQVMGWEDYHVHGGTLHAENVRVGGTVDRPTFNGAVTLVDADVAHAFIEEAQAQFTASRDAVVLHTAHLRQRGATYHVTGRIEEIDWQKRDARLRMTVEGKDIHIADIARQLEISLQAGGEVSLKAQVGGTLQDPTAMLHLRVTDGQLGDAPLDLALDAVLEEHILSIKRGRLRTGQGGFDIHRGTLDTRPNGRMDVTFSGQDIPLQWLFGALGIERKVDGTFAILDGTLGGTLDKPAGSVRLVVKNPILEGEQLGDLSGRLTLAHRVVRFEDFQAQRERATARLAGTIDLDRHVDLTVTAQDVPLRWLRPFIPNAPQLGGTARVTLRARGTTDSPDVMGTVDVQNLVVGVIQFDRLRVDPLTITRNAIVIAPGALRLLHRADDGKEHSIIASGAIPIVWRPWGLDRDAPLHLEAHVTEGDLGLLTAFTPSVRQARGRLSASVTVDGTLNTPRVAGSAVIADGRIVLRPFDHVLENVSGALLLSPDRARLVLQHLTGKLRPRDSERTGGDFLVDGSVPLSYTDWDLDRQQPLQLQVRIDEGDLSLLAFLHPTLSASSGALRASLTIAGTPDAPHVTGNLSVKDGMLSLPAIGGMVEN